MDLSRVIDIKDPRRAINIKHNFSDILFVLLFGIISNCEDMEEIEDYSNSCIDVLQKYIPLKNGIPSHDTLQRVLSLLDSDELIKLIQVIKDLNPSHHICIDGKQIGGKRQYKSDGLLCVNAWCTENKISLGETSVSNKESEKTAIKNLIKHLNLEDKVVTIDAMGTDQETLSLLNQKKAKYIFAVKKNQKTLLSETEHAFIVSSTERYEESSLGHGRVETRVIRVLRNLESLLGVEHWTATATQIIELTKQVYDKKTGQSSSQQRFFITNLEHEPKHLMLYIREHWLIESHLHWCLDVYFNEDQFRIHDRNAAHNLHLLRQIVLKQIRSFTDDALKNNKKKINKAKRDPLYAIQILLN